MDTKAKPIEIKREDYQLSISWSDGSSSSIESELLRRKCPCATCGGSLNHDKPLSPVRQSGRASLTVIKSEKEVASKIIKIWTVGQYALGVRWGDTHDTGIYTWDYLKNIDETSREN